MMHMTFYWGTKVTLLFDFWKTQTLVDYSLTLIACFLFSSFYQYLEHRRIQFNHLSSSSSPPSTTTADAAAALESPLLARPLKSVRLLRLSSALLFGVNSAIGYMLMLAVMSFNGGVFLALVFGLTVGHLAFRSNSDLSKIHDAVADDNPCACA